MQDVHQVAQDAERTKVYCELKGGRDAVKAERDTNGGVSFKERRSGRPYWRRPTGRSLCSSPALKVAVAEHW